eukprot:2856375-Prymnesium_polylepis.2
MKQWRFWVGSGNMKQVGSGRGGASCRARGKWWARGIGGGRGQQRGQQDSRGYGAEGVGQAAEPEE